LLKTETTTPDMKKVIQAITNKIDVKELANVVRDNVKKRIDTGKNADGSSMTPLKPATIKTKQKQGGIDPRKPLVFKGGTQKGVQAQTVSKKEAHVVSTGMAKGYFGKNVSSKEVLKFQRDKGRDPFAVSKDDVQDVIKLVKKQLGR